MTERIPYRAIVVVFILIMLIIATSFSRTGHDSHDVAALTAMPDTTTVPTPAPVDWREIMVQAAASGDRNTGIAAQEELHGDLQYDDLFLLAKIIACECGPAWEDWGIMAIGEVVLNRVASPEFPNTIREVLYQDNPMQYEPVWTDGWENYIPAERYVRLALRLIDGERPLGDPTIVFQALFPQGSGIALAYHDDTLNNDTYFCWTSYPDVYV